MDTPSSRTDQALENTLTAARAGEEWAWREVYAELAPSVIGFLRARGAAEPEDIAGEAFVQVVRDLPRFEGNWANFRAWVFSIARNRMIDAGRRAARRPDEPAADPEVDAGPVGDVAGEALARLDLERAVAILSELSDDQRDVLLLRIIGDLAIDEVARILGKRPGAVKQLQRRGLAAARKHLGQEAGDA
jgi:RNA polymerase sigma-70 factor (ECF subfamily)